MEERFMKIKSEGSQGKRKSHKKIQRRKNMAGFNRSFNGLFTPDADKLM